MGFDLCLIDAISRGVVTARPRRHDPSHVHVELKFVTEAKYERLVGLGRQPPYSGRGGWVTGWLSREQGFVIDVVARRGRQVEVGVGLEGVLQPGKRLF